MSLELLYPEYKRETKSKAVAGVLKESVVFMPVNALNGRATSLEDAIAALDLLHAAYEMPS